VTATFCWLALGVWFSAPRRARERRPRTPRRGPSPRQLQWIAPCVATVATIALLGPVRGAVLGVIVSPLVVVGVRRLGSRAQHRDDHTVSARMPLVLDLLAATLRAGQPVASALVAVAPLGGEHVEVELRRIAGLLRYGAEPAVAWGSLTIASLAPVGRIACRSAESGIRLAYGFELLAAELRDEARAAAVARAHRAGVWAMAPLGLCFLPAFACLGVLPVIAGIAHGVFAGAGR
jgi:pilus assembly protein TadC